LGDEFHFELHNTNNIPGLSERHIIHQTATRPLDRAMGFGQDIIAIRPHTKRHHAMGFWSILGSLSPVHIYTTTILKRARRIGRDGYGNVYYESKALPGYTHPRRWVIYANTPDPTTVPPEWHGWLHYQTDTAPLPGVASFRRPWQKPHAPNQTGTDAAYLPAGHPLRGGHRPRGMGDYEPWIPEASVPEVLTKERKTFPL
jgi:NADH:ubiquinone oxidoreductase subunit